MNPVMIDTKYGIRVTDNDEILSSVIKSLVRNNSFTPNIKRTIFSLSKNNEDYTLATTVFFADGTKTTVKNIMNDKVSVVKETITLSDGSTREVETASSESKEIGIAYAILKRVVCQPDKNGTVKGCGFLNFLRKTVDNAWDQNVEEARTKGENSIKKTANKVEKKEKVEKPSLRKCVQTLSDLLTKIDGKLSK